MRNNNIQIENKFHYNFNYLNNPRIFNDLLLFQLGEIYCDNSAAVESHTHDNFFEITFVLSGQGIAYANKIPVPLTKFDLFLSLPNEEHKIISDKSEPLRYYFFAFSFKPDSTFYPILYNNKMLKLNEHLRIYNSSSIAGTFPELISQIESENEYASLKFELLAKLLTINIVQVYTKIHTKIYTSPVIDSEQALYRRIINYIDHNLTKINHLSDIANDLNYNYVYLSRIFKNKFGKSIYAYFSDKKLDLAKQLIESSSLSITEIAAHLNYSSIFVFSRIFKNKFGISPNAYKAKCKTKHADKSKRE